MPPATFLMLMNKSELLALTSWTLGTTPMANSRAHFPCIKSPASPCFLSFQMRMQGEMLLKALIKPRYIRCTALTMQPIIYHYGMQSHQSSTVCSWKTCWGFLLFFMCVYLGSMRTHSLTLPGTEVLISLQLPILSLSLCLKLINNNKLNGHNFSLYFFFSSVNRNLPHHNSSQMVHGSLAVTVGCSLSSLECIPCSPINFSMPNHTQK